MAEKNTLQKTRRRKSKSNTQAHAASMLSMATQNLINMVAVGSVSGAVLLTLLAAMHF
jgi:hypothetical protein